MPDNRYFFFIAVLVRIGFRYTNFQGIKGGKRQRWRGGLQGAGGKEESFLIMSPKYPLTRS